MAELQKYCSRRLLNNNKSGGKEKEVEKYSYFFAAHQVAERNCKSSRLMSPIFKCQASSSPKFTLRSCSNSSSNSSSETSCQLHTSTRIMRNNMINNNNKMRPNHHESISVIHSHKSSSSSSKETNFIPSQHKNLHRLSIILSLNLLLLITLATAIVSGSSISSSSSASNALAQEEQQQQLVSGTSGKQQQPAVIQSRAGGLEPGDYVDEAGELEVMANQQQIPTAQLMAAAGHIVPDNFFLPGGSIPALQYHHAHQQATIVAAARLAAAAAAQHQQQQQASAAEQLQQAASQVQVRHVAPSSGGKFSIRPADLLAAATAAIEQQQQQQQQQESAAGLIDFNGYNLVGQTAAENAAAAGAPAGSGPVDLIDFLNPSASNQYEQQQQQLAAEQQIAAELASLHHQQQRQHQHQQHYQRQQQQQQNALNDLSSQSSDNSLTSIESLPASGGADQYSMAQMVGPAYQILQQQQANNQQQQQQQQDHLAAAAAYAAASYEKQQQHHQSTGNGKPFGLPTKSSSKEPDNMLKPIGNPKTISSPVIDFVANQLPKTSPLEQITNKIPQVQTPTVFSFSSSKDPSEKMKVVQQKKRTVMRQAENFARAMIKSVNDKFGTTIGDQTDIPFLLSSIGPLGMAQNLLTDPTLLVTLLNSAERIYFSDSLPGPAKNAMAPVLNIFRVPNKKRDKANLLNVISFLASGGQTPTSTPPKHRQGTGVEKASKGKSRR